MYSLQRVGPLVSEVEEMAVHYQRPAKNEMREQVGRLLSATDIVYLYVVRSFRNQPRRKRGHVM